MDNTELHVARALRHIDEAREDLLEARVSSFAFILIEATQNLISARTRLEQLAEAMKADNKQGG